LLSQNTVATGASCKAILDAGHSIGDGVYEIDPDGAGGVEPFDVYCDMTTDGGGWTLVAYAGTITDSKSSTTGKSNAKWLPLIFSYGIIDSNAMSTKNTFSKFDLFKSNAISTDEFMVKRTSNSNNIIIFPITNLSWFGRSDTDGHFNITSDNRDIAYLKLTNSGNSGFKTVTNGTKWSYLNDTSDNYPGIDWNVPEGENSDGYGSYDTKLNHRSLLYWESHENSYSNNQWFHASPLKMTPSSSPDNSVQDIEFWYR
jgi:hypothetical protein